MVKSSECRKLDQPADIQQHAAHVCMKGSTADLHKELGKCVSGRLNIDYMPALLALKVEINSLLGNRQRFPLSHQSCLESRNQDTSPGMPWKAKFPKFSDLREAFSDADLVKHLEATERAIVCGKSPLSPFWIFSKNDKYSKTKVQKSAFRSIQCPEWTCLAIMTRYLATVAEEIEVIAPWMHVKTTDELYQVKVAERFANVYAWGVDYTAFDKHEASEITSAIFRILFSYTTAPPAIVEWVVATVCTPTYLLPDGQVILAGNSNPSGQFLTSVINSLYHMVISLDVYAHILDIPCSAVLQRVTLVCTSDDGVDGCASYDDALLCIEHYVSTCTARWCIPAKLDLCEGELYPPGILPPYLSMVEVICGDLSVKVPADCKRMLAHVTWSKRDCTPESRLEQFHGVMNAMRGFLTIEQMQPDYPIPVPFQDFRILYHQECEKLGESPIVAGTDCLALRPE